MTKPDNSKVDKPYTYLQAIKDGYHVVNKESMIIYRPNLISIRRKIISA